MIDIYGIFFMLIVIPTTGTLAVMAGRYWRLSRKAQSQTRRFLSSMVMIMASFIGVQTFWILAVVASYAYPIWTLGPWYRPTLFVFWALSQVVPVLTSVSLWRAMERKPEELR